MGIKLANRGVEIVTLLFPTLELVPKGSFWDMYGIDALLGRETVQIKYDRRIATSQNLWHEIYEKSALNDEQKWRKSPGNADTYIFTTESTISFTAYKVSVNVLALAELDRKMIGIKPNNGQLTSMGFLINIKNIESQIEIKRQLKNR